MHVLVWISHGSHGLDAFLVLHVQWAFFLEVVGTSKVNVFSLRPRIPFFLLVRCFCLGSGERLVYLPWDWKGQDFLPWNRVV